MPLFDSCCCPASGSGEALTTRVYRGHPPVGATCAGVALLSLGGTSLATDVEAYEMGAAWTKVGRMPCCLPAMAGLC
jgi:hypothetical protein